MTPKPEFTPPDRDEIRRGLLAALGLYLQEADLTFVPGETGTLFANLQVRLEHGKVLWSKGAVFFERRIDLVAQS